MDLSLQPGQQLSARTGHQYTLVSVEEQEGIVTLQSSTGLHVSQTIEHFWNLIQKGTLIVHDEEEMAA